MQIPGFGAGTLVYVGIFLGVLLVFEGLRQLLSREEDPGQARNRRMRMIAGGATPQEVLSLLKPRAARWALHRLPLVGDLPEVLRRGGITIRPGVYLGACVAVMALVTLAGMPRVGLLGALAAGFLLGIVLPVTVVRRKQAQRMEQLTRQLPDALELMSRGLRVGHPLNATIGTVARDMADPIATEFGIIVDQIAYGDDLVDAFADFADRVGTEDAQYLSTSVAIQNGTGGDLGRILITLSKVIRGRIAMRRKIQAISSEGRLTATFLSALPVVIPALTSLTAPNYYPGVMDDPLFKPMASAVLVLVVANYLAMRRLVNFTF